MSSILQHTLIFNETFFFFLWVQCVDLIVDLLTVDINYVYKSQNILKKILNEVKYHKTIQIYLNNIVLQLFYFIANFNIVKYFKKINRIQKKNGHISSLNGVEIVKEFIQIYLENIVLQLFSLLLILILQKISRKQIEFSKKWQNSSLNGVEIVREFIQFQSVFILSDQK
eukprot:TRINITY_DN25463_c0_g1_i1.p1 TRINITY_DN25463_c0_g1~~TRINITY_DN25463_c0_g1_i1.p1  ORF type:complete len:170 (-),score=2.36 TRINITY_DN25463_c0_g1_i1:469-978(-)